MRPCCRRPSWHQRWMGQVRALRNAVSTGIVAKTQMHQRGVDWMDPDDDHYIDPGAASGGAAGQQPWGGNRGELLEVHSVAAAKMALPIDYLREDLSARALGRRDIGSGRVCSICGWFEAEPDLWFCPTCGAADPATPEASRDDGEVMAKNKAGATPDKALQALVSGKKLTPPRRPEILRALGESIIDGFMITWATRTRRRAPTRTGGVTSSNT